MDTSMTGTPTKEERNLAVIMDIAMFFFFFFSPLIVYLLKSESTFLREQAKESLNMNITVTIFSIISGFLSFIVIGLIGLFVIGLYLLVTVILAAIANSKGDLYRYPFILRLIK
ncbi:MAG: DUF4870 domain-containing protein [Acidithiobacillus sp.]|uniref:DUF4870 domain-containing protein n=1 Tax=Acidithiobacillus sp. TaxID=1872118 RepID=UPI003D03B3C1